MLGVRPSFTAGFVRRGESKYPELWQGLIGAWSPFLGPTGTLIYDMSGKQRNGTPKGTAYSVPSRIGHVIDLDGDSDYIEIADHVEFSPILTPLSIVALVNMDDATSFPIITKGIYNTDGEWLLATDATDKLYAHFFDESVVNCYIGQLTTAAVTTACQTKWVQIAMTYNGGILSAGIKLYIDGNIVASGDNENDTFVSVEDLTHAVWIGRDNITYANGQIGNVAIYNRELKGAEIAFLADNPFCLFEKKEMFEV